MSSRASDIEIIGKYRIKSSSKVRNKPMLPIRVAQSQTVGTYSLQLEGTKSRAKLVITMTNRSTHIPTFTERATKNSARVLVRTLGHQSNCGMTQLRAIKPQKIQPYGPKARFFIMDCSNTSPLYQAINASMMYP